MSENEDNFDPMDMVLTGGLTIKQWRFCEEYLKDYNAHRAYRAVYDAASDGSGGTNTLRSPKVLQYIQHRLEIRFKAADVDEDFMFAKLKELIHDPDPDVRNTALKTLQAAMKSKNDVEVKLKELEARKQEAKQEKSEETINLNIKTIKGDE